MVDLEEQRLGSKLFPLLTDPNRQMQRYEGMTLRQVFDDEHGHTWMAWFMKRLGNDELLPGSMDERARKCMREHSKYKDLREYVKKHFP